MGILLFEDRLKVDPRSFSTYVFRVEFLLGNEASGPGTRTIGFLDILNVMFDAKITEIGLFLADICLYTDRIIPTSERVRFFNLLIDFFERSFSAQISIFSLKLGVKRFGLSHNIDDYMRFSRSNWKIIATRGTLVDHS